MQNKSVPYLCGGTFFVLLEQAKGKKATRRQLKTGKKDRVSNKNMLEALIQFLVPSFQKPPAGDTFEGDTSDYKACKVSYGENLPFDDDVEIQAFDSRIKTNYLAVLAKMDDFIDSYLRTDSDERMQWLIQALLTLVDKDRLILPETPFYLSETPVTKTDLLALDHYCLSSLMLAIWHFIVVNRPDNEAGRDTFFALHERADEIGAKWKFKKSFGMSYPRDIGDFDLFGCASMGEEETKKDPADEAEPNEDIPVVEVYEAPYTDPQTQQQAVAQFHVEAKDNGIAIGQVFGGLVIGKRGGKDE